MNFTNRTKSNFTFEWRDERTKESDSVKPAYLNQLFRYVTGKYSILLMIGIINAIIAGLSFPARLVLVRDTFNEVAPGASLHDMASGMREKVKWFAILATIGGVTSYIFWMAFIVIGLKISYELKWRYLKAVLSQDWAWYDSQNIEELPTQINVNISEIENASGKNIWVHNLFYWDIYWRIVKFFLYWSSSLLKLSNYYSVCFVLRSFKS